MIYVPAENQTSVSTIPENNEDCFFDLRRMFSGNHWFRCVSKNM